MFDQLSTLNEVIEKSVDSSLQIRLTPLSDKIAIVSEWNVILRARLENELGADTVVIHVLPAVSLSRNLFPNLTCSGTSPGLVHASLPPISAQERWNRRNHLLNGRPIQYATGKYPSVQRTSWTGTK